MSRFSALLFETNEEKLEELCRAGLFGLLLFQVKADKVTIDKDVGRLSRSSYFVVDFWRLLLCRVKTDYDFKKLTKEDTQREKVLSLKKRKGRLKKEKRRYSMGRYR